MKIRESGSGARCGITIVLLLCSWAAFESVLPVNARAANGSQVTADAVMAVDGFWRLIGETTQYEADPERQFQAMHEVLRALSLAEIEAFERRFQREQRRAYTWDLWGAAYLINGGASDDGFEYFQRWLISRGRAVFETAIADPDSLGDALAPGTPGTYEFEEFATVASAVWAERTGIVPWSDPQARYPYRSIPPASEPAGVPFKEDDVYLARRYPKLWARFGTSRQ
jgi:hypothetical protein